MKDLFNGQFFVERKTGVKLNVDLGHEGGGGGGRGEGGRGGSAGEAREDFPCEFGGDGFDHVRDAFFLEGKVHLWEGSEERRMN